jgi:transcriptional regulator with XRE-family HTH domain
MDELKEFMARHRLTQEDIAEAIGRTPQFVSQMILGRSNPLSTTKALLAFCQSREPGMTFERLFASKAA